MHVGMGVIFQGAGEGRTDRNVYRNELRLGRSRRAARIRIAVGRRASLHGIHDVPGRAAVPDLLRRAHAAGSNSARWWSCFRGTTRCASPSKSSCSITCRTGASSSASAAASVASSSRASASTRRRAARRFVEAAQMILEGLERGYCEFDGKFVKQVRRDLRPRPFKSFRGRTLRRGGVARIVDHHGEARHRDPDHSRRSRGKWSRRSSTEYRRTSTTR